MPLLFVLATLSIAQQYPWPLQTDPGLSASFCEFRPRHFHSGVDLKTWSARSRPCIAIADGVVRRIKVQPAGYGKALYLTLPDGNVAVYAHLDKFAPEITERVRAYQEATGNFEVDLFWEGDSGFSFKKGEIVAYSGVSGTVHPHLHFEIRDPYQRPLNPLTHGIYIADHLPPIPVGIAITPLDGSSTVEGDIQTRLYSRLLRQPNGSYTTGDPIGVSGRIGIAIDAYDQADAATNEMAAYKIDLEVSGETYWTTEFEKFDFDQTKLIEVERDYQLLRRGKGSYHRLYRVQGNRLGFLSGDGVIDAGLADKFPIYIKISIADVAGNTSFVVFQLVSDTVVDTSRGIGGKPLIEGNGWSQRSKDAISLDLLNGYVRLGAQPGVDKFSVATNREIFLDASKVGGGVSAGWDLPRDWNGIATITALTSADKIVSQRDISVVFAALDKATVFYSEDSLCQIEVPVGSVYDDIWLELEPEAGYDVPGQVKSVFRVEPRDQPLKNPVSIRMKYPVTGPNSDHWGVYYYDRKSGWTFLGREKDGIYLTGKATSWEKFALVLDTIPPIIEIGLPKTKESTSTVPEFSAVIKDQLSGISSNRILVWLDGRKIPAEYDQPRARVYYRPWKSLAKGSHKYEIEVTDRAGNTTRKSVGINII